jgi:hypothetical protein
MWLLSYGADGEFRVCIPMSDVMHGQVDEGVKLLLDVGGKIAQRDFTVEMKRRTLVPVVIAVTKFDLIAPNVSSSHEEHCRSQFGNMPAEIVSSIYYFLYAAYNGWLISLLCFQQGQSFAVLSTN